MFVYYNWLGENFEVVYGEGFYIGYWYYDWIKIVFLFFFGYGLFYIIFEYGCFFFSFKVFIFDNIIEFIVVVSNIGDVVGLEMV